ncbi:alpha/beta hydrolase family protein [Alkalihalophilus sp. As8PL]|uniref:Alpha/beta hydrolase family protein n=1 Tax=Alkalihalophilus sp. As8PL TaxID=3237103 RepID=A0AB39BY06_9BACI
MSSKEVSFEKGDIKISGTIDIPSEGPPLYPAVLILSGSGPLDRDGNGKGKQVFNLYNSLSTFLVKNGCLTLRYDKRGVGKSTGSYMEAGMWDLVEDARAALRFLKRHPQVDPKRVFIVGHSEGAMLAPAVIEGEKVSGLILLAGAAESMAEALSYQRHQMVRGLQGMEGIRGKLLNLFKVIERAEKQGPKFDEKMMKTDAVTTRFQGVKVNAKWFREHYQFNVRESLKKVECPVLAVTGAKDLQVIPERVFEVEKLVKGPVEAKIIQGMNHMLRDQEEDYSILQLKKAYKQTGTKPLSHELTKTMRDWLANYV